ncbi:MAG: radical SAM protein [Fimbriimonadales bacterium]
MQKHPSVLLNNAVEGSKALETVQSFRGAFGLYVHVPFCSSICPFCPYNKVRYAADEARDYFQSLKRELTAYASCLKGPFTTLYVGGGTPTLCLDELAETLEGIPIAGERAIEVLPLHATEHVLGRLRKMGFTYVSLGIQSFDDRVLKHLGRPHRAVHNHQALANAKGRFDCIDADLIFDLAFASPESFLWDFEECIRAGVDQTSTYPLMRFGYTPFGKGRHDRRSEHRVLAEATRIAADHGYERRSVWTFNRVGAPNYSSITREFYLGVGAGAATYTGEGFTVNHFGLRQYAAAINEGRLPIARRIALGPLRSATFYAFWQAYTGRIDLGRLLTSFPGARPLVAAIRVASRLGLVALVGDEARLTPRGYDAYHDLERWITYAKIEPMWEQGMREHQAAG